MRSIESLLAEYNASHGNRINKVLHWICVPLIVISLLGLLWQLKMPLLPVQVNGAEVLTGLAMIYYLILSPRLALGMLLVTALMLTLLNYLERSDVSLWRVAVVVFVIAWAGQFIGHHIEGKRPSFFKDIQFLLIGPLWLLSFVYRKFNITY